MQYARTIIGYHGCDLDTATRLLNGGSFQVSSNSYDWLGQGIYFWEFGPNRAWRFALKQARRGRINTPAIVGAIIQLGHCFDLLDTQYTNDLAHFYPAWLQQMQSAGLQVPSNRGTSPDFKGRYLDCAVINGYLDMLHATGTAYDTVRGCFREGSQLWSNAGLHMETHIQVAVRNPDCIIGVFRPTAPAPHGV